MNNIKKVEFVFENCECFEIDEKYFGMFQIADIKTEIYRIACNAISKLTTAYTVALEIFSEANTDYNPCGSSERSKKFDRITSWRDITSIILYYDDGKEETYYVDYVEKQDGVLGTENINQRTYISSLGNLYLVITKDKDIKDFFETDEIECKESLDFSKMMILD